mmetsp:Transcript_20266/g.26234  ORF Transcript_20266/g.26234 Transcript_20266/m.26234 type:complete len:387 (+) Transcript_20266:69-1229(+)
MAKVLSKAKKWLTSNKGRLEIVGGVTACILIELYKEQIIQNSYWIGILAMMVSFILACVYQYEWQDSYSWQILFTYVCTLFLIFVALIGWWVCQEKKDQLNLKRALAQLRKTLYEWTDAQQRLEGAIVGIKMNDKKVKDIQSEIEASLGDIQRDFDRLTTQQGADIMDRLRDTVSKLVSNCNQVADDVLQYAADEAGSDYTGPQPSDGRHMTDIGIDAFRGLLVHMLDPDKTPRYLDILSRDGISSFQTALSDHEMDANRVLGNDLNAFLKQRAKDARDDPRAVTAGSLVNDLVKRSVALTIMLGAEAVAERDAFDVALMEEAAKVIRQVQETINLRIITYHKFAERLDRTVSSMSNANDDDDDDDDEESGLKTNTVVSSAETQLV